MKNSSIPMSSNEVYDDLLKRIIELKLSPGEKISENTMADEYGVSRSIIRTAFTRLQQIGFIEIYPQRGTYVSMMDLNKISDLLMLRTALEKEVLYELFTKYQREDREALLKKLDANIAEEEKCRGEHDYLGQFPELDSQFHRTMMESVGRVGLQQVLGEVMTHIARWRNFDVAFDNRIPDLIEEHKNIVEAIRRDDLRLAQSRVAEHLATITGIADRALAKYPTYFVH